MTTWNSADVAERLADRAEKGKPVPKVLLLSATYDVLIEVENMHHLRDIIKQGYEKAHKQNLVQYAESKTFFHSHMGLMKYIGWESNQTDPEHAYLYLLKHRDYDADHQKTWKKRPNQCDTNCLWEKNDPELQHTLQKWVAAV